LYFSPDGLALGAGTILLPAVAPRDLANLQGEEMRLLALLSATYGKAISPSVLGNIERAAKSWREGDDALAAIHLAHAALPCPAAIVAGAIEAFRLIFVPKANRIRVEGDIAGLPGGHYSWNRDEKQLYIGYKSADGEQRTFTAQRKGNKFLGPQGQVVGTVLPD